MAEMITIPLPDSESCEALLARPADAASGDLPGVLLMMDAIGLRDQIGAMADRIASWGAVVLAPNVMHQAGTVAQTRPEAPLLTAEARHAYFAAAGPRLHFLFSGENRTHLLMDLRGYADALHALPGVSEGPIGITGYCMGARLAMLLAGELGEGVAAVGGFHGGNLVTDDELSPHLALPASRAEYWFGHAENDASNTPEQQQVLDDALSQAGLVHGAQQYPGAPHGFTMADTANHHRPSEELHWRHLQALFARTLGTQG